VIREKRRADFPNNAKSAAMFFLLEQTDAYMAKNIKVIIQKAYNSSIKDGHVYLSDDPATTTE